jgi:3',5'-cyclic AMP phosphodiesterase CpdA
MRYEQKGFGALGVVLIFAMAVVLGLAGWRVYTANSKKASTSPSKTALKIAPKPKAAVVHKRVVALGDMVCDPNDRHKILGGLNYCQDALVAKLTSLLNPDAVLALGDLQYDDGALQKFQTTFDKNWGVFKKIMYPTPGNHEYITPQAGGYYSYFKDGPIDVSKGYYSFSLGKWFIVSLNSNCDKIGGCSRDSEQLKWLEQQLSANQAKCTLAFWHHPRFTSGNYVKDSDTKDRSKYMWEKLEKYKADLVLNGHDHLYERFAPQQASGNKSDVGIRQFTVGTGGKSHYDATSAEVNSEKIIDDQFGVLLLDLQDDKYDWQFKNTAGQVLDSGTQNCSA